MIVAMVSMVQTAEELDAALLAADSPALSRASAPRDLLRTPTLGGLLRLALIEWAGIAIAWYAMWVLPAFCYPLLALFVGGRLHALGVILHDFTHMPLRARSVTGTLVEILSGYPIATTMLAMRYHHLRHHRDSGMPSDPYFKRRLGPVMYTLIWLRHILLIPFWTLRPVVGLLSLAFPKLRNVYAKAWLQDRSGLDVTHSADVIACAKAELGQFVFQAIVIAALVVFPSEVWFFYLLPAVAAGLLAGYRVLREHDYAPTIDRKITTIMRTTNDHGRSILGHLFTAPRHIGYHVVHHIHPQVRLQDLPALRRWYRQEYPQYYRT
jgi:fatty acid desaturase